MDKGLFIDRAIILRLLFEGGSSPLLSPAVTRLIRSAKPLFFDSSNMSAIIHRLKNIEHLGRGSYSEYRLPSLEDEANKGILPVIEKLLRLPAFHLSYEKYKQEIKSRDHAPAEILSYLFQLMLIARETGSEILLSRARISVLREVFKEIGVKFNEDSSDTLTTVKVTASQTTRLGLPAGSKHKSIRFIYADEQNHPDTATPLTVILTAIKEEYLAVRQLLEDLTDVEMNNTVYEKGKFFFDSRLICEVVIRECGPKTAVAAQETERAIQFFHPGLILFVGIAGSRKPKDFGIGDVIFPEKIYSYEGGKADKHAFYSRPEMQMVSYKLFELAKKERLKEDWKSILRSDGKQAKADVGIIASGDQLIEHMQSGIGNIISMHYNDASAVEMEGFGFLRAAARQGAANREMLFGVVRGISDILARDSDVSDADADRRPADNKHIAANNAAGFAFWLVYKFYSQTIN